MIPHSRPLIGIEESEAVSNVLESGWLGGGGPAAVQFGSEVASVLGRADAVAVSSGTVALEIALRLVIRPNDRVAIPSLACAAVERAVSRAGARPVPIDADPDDLSLPKGFLAGLDSCEAAILVHQFGLPAQASLDIAECPVPVIEDATTAIGGSLSFGRVGSFGSLVVCSFAATKMLCAAEAGIIAGEREVIDAARLWTDPESVLPSGLPVPNAKLPDIAAAVGRAQLPKLPRFLARRAQIAQHYDSALGGLADRVLRPGDGSAGTWWRYLIRVEPERVPAIVATARERNVMFACPVMPRADGGAAQLPIARLLQRSLVSVPIYPALTDTEVEAVASVLAATVRG